MDNYQETHANDTPRLSLNLKYKLTALVYALGMGLNYSFGATKLIEVISSKVFGAKDLDPQLERAIDGTCFLLMSPLMHHVYQTYLPKLINIMNNEQHGNMTKRGLLTGGLKGFATAGSAWSMFLKLIPGAGSTAGSSMVGPTAIGVGMCYAICEASLFSSVDHERKETDTSRLLPNDVELSDRSRIQTQDMIP